MKKRYLALAAIPVIAAVICIILLLPKSAHAEGYVSINSTNFPDEWFRVYVKQRIDKDNDDKLTDSERLDVTSISLYWLRYLSSFDNDNDGVRNLKGIEYFPNLTKLSADNMGVHSMNLSNNQKLKMLYCGNNQLTELDLSNNPDLYHLYCDNNQLTELDLSNNEQLVEINCSHNQLTALYLSSGSGLRLLDCSCNELPGLTLTNKPLLFDLLLYCNPGKKYNITETGMSRNYFGMGSDYYYTESIAYEIDRGNGYVETDYYVNYVFCEYDGEFIEHEYDFLRCDEDDVIITLDTPKVSAANTSSGIKISWNNVENASQYEVWRAPKGSSSADFTLLTTIQETSYTDKTAVTGEAYTYRVCAKDGCLYSKNAAVSITRTAQDPQNPFTDVPSSASYYDAVMWAVQNGITSGTSATTFSPNADCTRYQFAVMLYKLAGKPAVSGTLPFKDVKKTASYYKAVLWAYSNGIISGTSKTTFSPNDGVKRYQAVAMLYKFAGKPAVSGTLKFKDVSKKASYYNAVLWAVQNGITKGTDSTHFSPNAVCKRYQLVVFLYKFNNIYHYK